MIDFVHRHWARLFLIIICAPLFLPFFQSYIIDYDYFLMGKSAYHIVDSWSYSFYGKPTSWFPPFTPALLALLQLLGGTPLSGIMFFNILMFIFLNNFIFSFAKKAGHSDIQALIMTLLITLTTDLIEVFTLVNSDTLIFLLIVLYSLCLWNYLEKPSRKHLLQIALIIALGSMQKSSFLALSFVPLFLSWSHSPNRREKIIRAILFIFFAFLPQALWMMRNYWQGLPLTGRAYLASEAPAFNDLLFFIKFARWSNIAPQTVNLWIYGCIFFFLLIFAFVITGIARKKTSPLSYTFTSALLVNICFYVFITLYAFHYYDYNIQFDTRLAFPMILLLFLLAIYHLSILCPFKWFNLLLLLLLVGKLQGFIPQMSFLFQERISGKLNEIIQSPAIDRMNELAQKNSDAIFFSNRPHLLFGQVHASTNVYKLRRDDPSIGKVEDNIRQLCDQNRCYLWFVTLHEKYWQLDPAISWNEINEMALTTPIYSDAIGTLYHLKSIRPHRPSPTP